MIKSWRTTAKGGRDGELLPIMEDLCRRSGQKTEGDLYCYPSTIKEQVLLFSLPRGRTRMRPRWKISGCWKIAIGIGDGGRNSYGDAEFDAPTYRSVQQIMMRRRRRQNHTDPDADTLAVFQNPIHSNAPELKKLRGASSPVVD